MELKSYYAQDKNGAIIPGAYVYLYQKGTTTLVTGLEDSVGDPLTNPFQADEDGLFQVAAPDGVYDLRVTSTGRDNTIRVQFLDAAAAVSAISASADRAEIEADRAEAARDASQLTDGVYPDTATGLSGTVEGNYFSVPSATDNEYLVLYRHDAGPVATEIKRYPSASAIYDQQRKIENKLTVARGKNLLDPEDANVVLGFFVRNADGELQENASYNTTGFIPVDEVEYYTFSTKHNVAWFDAAKNFISGSPATDTNKTQLAPASAAYVRASATTATWSSFQIEQGQAQTAYEPFIPPHLPPGAIKGRFIVGSQIDLETLTPELTNFVRPKKNLFNKLTAKIGYFLSHTGTETQDANYDYSGFIRVKVGESYTSSHLMRFTTYYDANKNVVAGGSSTSITSFTPPAGVAFVRVTINHTSLDQFQLESGTTSTGYEGFQLQVVGPNGEPLASIPTSGVEDAAITPEKTNFLERGKNLFNKDAAIIGYFMGPDGSPVADATYDYSDLIPVTPGETYTSSKPMRFTTYYNENKAQVSGGSSESTSSFVVPAGVHFVRVTINHNDLGYFQLEAGAEPTSFQPFSYILKLTSGTPILLEDRGTLSWTGKYWVTMGDSISAQEMWQPHVVSALRLNFFNTSVGGTTIAGPDGSTTAMCQDARINDIPLTADLISVMGGTNDWAQSVPLGAEDSVDPTDFNGALNTLIEKITTRLPAARFLLFTPPYGEFIDYAGRGWTSPTENTLGLTSHDYAAACRKACVRWGIPCVDIHQESGWNKVNITQFVTDDGALLHPNEEGGKRIAEVVIGRLNDFRPL